MSAATSYTPSSAAIRALWRLERTDARGLDAGGHQGRHRRRLSFISLTKELPAALRLAAPDARRLGDAAIRGRPEAVGNGIVVRDAQARAKAVAAVRAFIDATPGWTVFAEMTSPILGGRGNEEVLIGARHGA